MEHSGVASTVTTHYRTLNDVDCDRLIGKSLLLPLLVHTDGTDGKDRDKDKEAKEGKEHKQRTSSTAHWFKSLTTACYYLVASHSLTCSLKTPVRVTVCFVCVHCGVVSRAKRTHNL